MTDRRIFRYEVPIDDKPHVITLDHSPVAVACMVANPPGAYVEFWCEHTDGAPPVSRTFQVFGTGHPLPEDARWIGTCERVHGLVFHLYEIGYGQP